MAAMVRNRYALTIPVLIDNMDNRVERMYAAWPARAYLTDSSGKLTYRSQGGSDTELIATLERALHDLANRDLQTPAASQKLDPLPRR
jgi:hypothetical protein